MTTTERHQPAAEPTTAEAADQVIYAVSHDLMGPLLNIRGFLGRLRQGCGRLGALAADWPLLPEQREAWNKILDDRVLQSVEILDQSAHRMQQRITALLELSRAGPEPVHLESVSAEALARAVAEELAGEAKKRGARVEVGPAPPVTADAGRLTAILRQLFLNALQFLAPSRAGTVHFGGRLQDGEAWLWVRDNGIGLRRGRRAGVSALRPRAGSGESGGRNRPRHRPETAVPAGRTHLGRVDARRGQHVLSRLAPGRLKPRVLPPIFSLWNFHQ